MTKNTALIFGVTGQDGSYLAELLLGRGYEVHGLVRRHSTEAGFKRIEHIKNKLHLHKGDLLDEASIFSIIQKIQPDEVYNLAAQSHVGDSSNMPIFTTQVNAIGVLTILEALRQNQPKCRFYQASSSEMFGNNVDEDGFQRETTVMNPVSPYACAKLYGYNIVNHYRNAYGMFVCNGILFNHESPRRGINFVTQKVVSGALDIVNGKTNDLVLGNLNSYRDWGHAKDYVYAMWLMLQHDTPDNFVISSGETHSVQELCNIVFTKLGLFCKDHIKSNEKYMRAEELKYLKGDCSKAKKVLGWDHTYNFESLIYDMIINNERYNECNMLRKSYEIK